MLTTEVDLVSGLKRRDADVFDAVYDHYQPRLYGFLLRLSGDRSRAEDLVQETFVRLAGAAPKLKPDTRLSAWLFRVARNLWFDSRRRALLDLDRLRELSLWPRSSASRATPFAHLAADETQARLERALAELPTPQREAILLVAVEGFSPQDAAVIADVQPATLRQRLRRARRPARRHGDDVMPDDLDEALRQLPPPRMSLAKRERARTQMRRALNAGPRRPRLYRSVIEPAMVAAVCGLQLVWLVTTVRALLAP